MGIKIINSRRKQAYNSEQQVVPTILLSLNTDTVVEKYIYLRCIEDPKVKIDLLLQRTCNFKKYLKKYLTTV